MASRQNSTDPPLSNSLGPLKAGGVCQSIQFSNIEQFSQTVSLGGMMVVQLDSEPFQGEIIRIALGELQLVLIKTNCKVYAHGTKPSDQVMFGTSLMPPDQHLIAHKTLLPQLSLFGFDPARDVNLICPAPLQFAQIVVSATRLKRYLQVMERDDLDDKFFRQNLIQLTDTAYHSLTAYLRQLFYIATVNPQLVQRSHALIAGDVLPLLINCFTAEVCPRLRILPFRRADLVQQAEAFVLTNLDQPLTLEAICRAVKTSKRALSYGFQDIFGMGPMTYLKLTRLNGVHRALKLSQPESATVLGVANRLGFWHMGHFSHDYKQMFGEPPSETLRNSKPDNS